jgi:hypothetical protein
LEAVTLAKDLEFYQQILTLRKNKGLVAWQLKATAADEEIIRERVNGVGCPSPRVHPYLRSLVAQECVDVANRAAKQEARRRIPIRKGHLVFRHIAELSWQDMAKLQPTPITAKDLDDFTANNSDFDFEMNVLALLQNAGLQCRHAGTYRDPVTDKIRQFDMRAFLHNGEYTLAMAVECKNFRPNNPLLISAMPRSQEEGFHNVLYYRERQTYTDFSVLSINGTSSAYKPGEMVGKKTDQVGRETNGDLVSNDEITFDKISQAINSCQGLIEELSKKMSAPPKRVIVPVLIVSSGSLWEVDYDSTGSIATRPHQVQRGTLFLDNTWNSVSPYGHELSYRLSHLEIVTLDGLPQALKLWSSQDGFLSH